MDLFYTRVQIFKNIFSVNNTIVRNIIRNIIEQIQL